ncbi:helix-turn-helix domain-containing protein [Promicromonospora sp. NPDC090134]|uniref:helix-turn-helix domain-containing protein n=1 Tax=Promicromonospora sp. NPDC090134 TaxID=3364408 RepID=UPI00381C6D51
MPDLAFAAREYLARHGIIAQEIADHMGRSIDYVLDQLTGEIPLGVDLVLALAALTADSPERVSAELASIAGTLVDPPRFDGQTMARALAQEIGEQRTARNMTQQQLAHLVGETPDTIEKYESGGLRVSLEALRRIAAALDTYATHVMIAAERRARHKPNSS